MPVLVSDHYRAEVVQSIRRLNSHSQRRTLTCHSHFPPKLYSQLTLTGGIGSGEQAVSVPSAVHFRIEPIPVAEGHFAQHSVHLIRSTRIEFRHYCAPFVFATTYFFEERVYLRATQCRLNHFLKWVFCSSLSLPFRCWWLMSSASFSRLSVMPAVISCYVSSPSSFCLPLSAFSCSTDSCHHSSSSSSNCAQRVDLSKCALMLMTNTAFFDGAV